MLQREIVEQFNYFFTITFRKKNEHVLQHVCPYIFHHRHNILGYKTADYNFVFIRAAPKHGALSLRLNSALQSAD